MRTRVTTVMVKPGKIDDVVAAFRDHILPVGLKHKGAEGAYILTDRQNNKVMIVGLWASEADLMAGETTGFYQEQVIGRLKDLISGPPFREVFDVHHFEKAN